MRSYKFINLGVITLLMLMTAACGITDYDNYDAPKSVLEGHVVYQGEPIHVRSGGVDLELWQPGYADQEKIPLNVDQDGSFSAKLFDGTYKLTQLAGDGPWVTNTDSMTLEISGYDSVNVEVEPFYMLRNVSLQNNSGTITGSFQVEQINDSRDVDYVALYVGSGRIVDVQYNEFSNSVAGDQVSFNTDMSISKDVPADFPGDTNTKDEKFVFARIGLKVAGKEDLIYSPVVKLEM